MFESRNKLGHHCIIRDSNGAVLVARLVLMNGGGDAFLVEAMSYREALSWLEDKSYDYVILESGTLNVVHGLNNNTSFHSPVGLIFKDCLDLIKRFRFFRLVYVCRSTNQATHLLARVPGSSINRGT